MIKKVLLISGYVLFNSIFCNAQDPKGEKIQTKFFRPSLTNIYVKSSSSEANTVIQSLRQVPVEKRFDDHNFNNNTFELNNSSNLSKEIKSQLYNQFSKQIIAKWFSRNSEGNMTSELIDFRGKNTATDADVIKDKVAENSRLSNLGYELMKKSYVIVYNISKVKSMTEIYNETDEKRRALAAKLNSQYTPVQRTEEGYEVEYTANVYKLDWNDSIQKIFYDDYFLDESYTENRQSRINAFNNSKYPFKFLESISGTISATQPNNADAYKFRVRKSMNQLLQESALEIHEEVIFKSSKKIEDFRVKVNLASVYPTFAKIGSKEGIYMNQRFFVYELDIAKNKKRKKATVRVNTIALNDSLANGKSPTSRFRQVGGRKIKPYYFLESKEDNGFSFTLGHSLQDSTVTSGYHVAIDARLDRLFKVYNTNEGGKYLRNLHASINLTANPFSGVKFEGDTKDSSTMGASFNLGLNIGREIFITKKGNLYLYPEIGGSLLAYNFIKINGTTLESKDPLSLFVNYGINASLGLGINVTSSMSIIIKPSYNLRLSEFVNINKTTDGTELKLANANNFRNANNASMPIFVGVRFRL
jgi:hypothetical protein